MRKRERTNDNNKNKIEHEENSVDEIVSSTLHALHCYILHKVDKRLFRLEKEENNSQKEVASIWEGSSNCMFVCNLEINFHLGV